MRCTAPAGTSTSFPKLSTNLDKEDDQKSYSYLTGITIFALTEEERKKLEDEYAKKLDEFETYKNTTIQQIWLNELNEFEEAYKKWLLDQKEENSKNSKMKKVTKEKKGTKKKVPNKTTKSIIVKTK